MAVRSQGHADALAQLATLEANAGSSEILHWRGRTARGAAAGAGAGRAGNRILPELLHCARLDYYTGTVYETTLTDHPQIGSICSGGRYEDLASHYSKSKLGVGISIGLSRLFWQLREAGLIDGIEASSVQALVALMDEQGMPQSLDIARRLRAGGINTEVQMEPKKIGKQFQYAAKAGIRFVVLAGEDELARGVVAVKDLVREQQFEVSRDELASTLQVELEQSKVM